MATVTVIIPTFNRALMLRQAVESVFAQTFTDYEIVVVDDGSTDETVHVLHPVISKIHYYYKPQGGPSQARNYGIARASGEYVAFLDSDDQWDPRFLEVVMEKARGNPSLGLISTVHRVMPSGMRRPKISQSQLEGDLYPLLFQKNVITTSAVLVKRTCLLKVGAFNENLAQAEDYDLWLRIAREYPIAVINNPLCFWHDHPSNVSRDELTHRLCLQNVVTSNYDADRISPKNFRLRQSKLQTSLGRLYFTQQQQAKANACFREAIRLAPFRFRPWWYFCQTFWPATSIKRGRAGPFNYHETDEL